MTNIVYKMYIFNYVVSNLSCTHFLKSRFNILQLCYLCISFSL